MYQTPASKFIYPSVNSGGKRRACTR